MGDETTITAQQGTAKPPQRLRLSIWAGTHLVTPSAIKGGENLVDDISLLKTLTVKTDSTHVAVDKAGKAARLLAPLQVEFDRDLLTPPVKPLITKPGDPPETADAKRQRALLPFFGNAIDACHQVGIQCLAGWDMARNDLPMQTMSLWFRDLQAGTFASKEAEIQRVVTQIVDLVNLDYTGGGKVVHFDGISFDIEQAPNKDKGGEAAVEFYQAVADAFAVATKDTNKFCGVAAGALVDDTHAHNNRTNGAITSQLKALDSAISTRWSMAKDHALLVMRPMAYDDFPLTNLPPPAKGAVPGPGPHQQPASIITEWHNDNMTYAASATGAPAEQFQLGIKTFAGTANIPKLVESPPGTFSWAGQDGCMTDPIEIRKRCRELRKRGYGLILFAFPQDWNKVATYNFVLNANHSVPTAFDDNPTSANDPEFQKNGKPWDGTILPGTLGVPRQQPHTLNTLDRLKNA